ncbi:MAG: chemotaxis protein CheY [Bacillales bacterium]|jgi:two-component system chemotaxis response regulator CheB|nr:chemotaxis protein CheY [Bacillales bacterium]
MKKYNILVVDDSAFMRKIITQKLEEDPSFSVIGIARDGVDAIEKIKRLKPDLVTMDVEMPKMNGIEALEKIMTDFPVPVVMLSSRTKEGAKDTIQALEIGAIDFFLKDTLINSDVSNKQVQEFFMRLKGILQAKPLSSTPVSVTRPQTVEKPVVRPQIVEPRKIKSGPIDLVFIGCSTGGPSALQAILPHIPKDFPAPVVVAQHMPAGFTKALADRFNTLCHLKVCELQDGQVMEVGNMYIAPAGFQTRFEKKHDGRVVFKVETESQALYKPCVDISLNSAAPIFKERLLSVILTGMGVDGMQGCGLVKENKGTVFVEAEQSCVVYGMPKAVKEAGYADGQYVLSQMVHEIISFVKK